MKSLIAVSAVVACALSAPVFAQDFPTRPITLVVPYAAGGSSDIIARTIAEYMSRTLPHPVVVENRPGAATAIAAASIATGAADGYTVMFAGSPTYVIAPALNPDAGYSGVDAFNYVSMLVNVPNILAVSKDSGIETIKAFIEEARSAPDAMSYASFGNGTLPHLTSLMFADEIGAQMLHIPYPGGAPAVIDMIAGNVETGFLNVPTLLPYIQSGDVIPLAVASTSRASALPDVPTMGELGLNEYEMGAWLGISVAAGTPPEVIKVLDEAFASVMANPEVRERIEGQGADMFYMNSADFTAFVLADAEVVNGLIETSGVKTAQ